MKAAEAVRDSADTKPDSLYTIWGENLNRNAPLTDYPRPQLMRRDWVCLNGYWDYVICPEGEAPSQFQGRITVPFTPETLLSGADRGIKAGEKLWYRRLFKLPQGFMKDRLLINFGAVDQTCEVYINGSLAGSHEGGYLPFSIDITEFIKPDENVVTVGVTDTGSTGFNAYGKQSEKPGGIWYTGQCGIWQTVWLESVPKRYIEKLIITPDYDASKIHIQAVGGSGGWFAIIADGKRVSVGELNSEGKASVSIPDFTPWTPEKPFLYDLLIKLGDDIVKSYFAMRKIGVLNGMVALNNTPLFLTGLLDQGYWSDGLYTAPSDEAIIYDIEIAKSLGFNLLRKHIKIEPLRWYYHCDRLGMLVWQDFPSGGAPYKRFWTQILPLIFGIHVGDTHYTRFGRRYERSRKKFELEMDETVGLLRNSPSVICWTIFNEGWGQFDSVRLTNRLRSIDSTRLIDSASGWHDRGVGDFKSRHIYFKKVNLKPDNRVLALTEFGGYTLKVEGHTACRSAFGYKKCEDMEEYNTSLESLYREQILPHKKDGLAVCIYTQLSDVEDELNGLITFDRRVLKADADKLTSINSSLKDI